MVMQIRQAIYPQLEFNRSLSHPFPMQQKAASPPVAQAPLEREYDDEALREPKPQQSLTKRRLLSKITSMSGGDYSYQREEKRLSTLTQIDSTARIQTGPGLPQWRWRSLPMRWNGPVESVQQVKFTLIPPLVNSLLSFLRVILLAALILIFFNLKFTRDAGFSVDFSLGRSAAALLLCGFLFCTATPADAEMPTPELLEELQSRFFEPAECLPDCATIHLMVTDLSDNELQNKLYLHAAEDVAVPLPAATPWATREILLDNKPAKALLRDAAGNVWLKVSAGRHQVLISETLPKRQAVQLAMPLKPKRVAVGAKGWIVEGVRQNGEPENQLQFRRKIKKDETGASIEPGALPPFVKVERVLHLGLEWLIETKIERLSPTGTPIILELPLLDGESITSAHVRVENNMALINMAANQSRLSYQSVFEKKYNFTITAPQTTSWTEIWRLNVSPIWHVITEGIPVIHHQDQSGYWQPEWRPWPGESITLTVLKPQGVRGPTLTVDSTNLDIRPGKRTTDATLTFTARSSRGGQHTVVLPEGAKLQTVAINNKTQPIRLQERSITIPIAPGSQTIKFNWHQPLAPTFRYFTQTVDMGVESVNNTIRLQMPRDRWILFAGGPRIGPAVLFWGQVLVILLIGLALGRVKITPLKTYQWILLGLGLSQVDIVVALLVVGWLLCLGVRKETAEKLSDQAFDMMQIFLVLLSVAAAGALIYAIQRGLLGQPEMQISGNGSSAYELKWYQDRAAETLPQAWIISVPLMVYRLAMLAWALWLAFALLKWLRWGWECFSTNGLWRELKKAPKSIKTQDAATTENSQLPELEIKPEESEQDES